MSLPFSRCGGLFLWATQYIRPTRLHMNHMGTMANQALFHFVLARWLSVDGVPMSGVLGGDLRVSSDGPSQVRVAPGVGLIYDPDATDEHDLSYRPVVVESEQVLELAAADPDQVRIDVISAGPSTVDDVLEDVWVRGSSGLSPQQLPTRRRFSSELEVTAGTPGGEAPATPAGHIRLAEVHVQPGGTGIQVIDCRPILTLSRDVRPVPGEDHVVEGLELTTGTEGLAHVSTGIAQFDGYRYRYTARSISPVENVTGHPRFDLVVAKRDGSIELIEGVGDLPSAGDAPSGTLVLGYVEVNADSKVTDATDLRERGTIGAAQMRADAIETRAIAPAAVTLEKMAEDSVDTPQIVEEAVQTVQLAEDARPIWVRLTYVSYSSSTRRHTIMAQLVDADGNPVARQAELSCTMRAQNWDPNHGDAVRFILTATGARLVSSGGASRALVRTGSLDGSVEIWAVHPEQQVNSNTVYLEVHPLGAPGGGGRIAFPMNGPP